MIFKNTFDDRDNYSCGLSKKKQDGTYENGFMKVQFRKDVNLENKTKIIIKSAWLSFNVYEKKTYPYIFINEFDIVEDKVEESDPFAEFADTIIEDEYFKDL
jgi:hypothetical protein